MSVITKTIVIDDPSGDAQELYVQVIGENLFRCLCSSDIGSAYMIYCGDEFKTQVKDSGHHALLHLYARQDIVHLRAGLGMFLYSGPVEKRTEAENELADGFENHPLLNFMKAYAGHAEFDDFFISVSLTLHVPREHQHAMLAALKHAQPGYAKSVFCEAISGEGDPLTCEQHVVLLGDSIFDNTRYVPDAPAIIEQLRSKLPDGWQATLLAADGSVAKDVCRQIKEMKDSPSHLVISCGGNDALRARHMEALPVATVNDALVKMAAVRESFRADYRAMLIAAHDKCSKVTVCTVYDSIPILSPELKTALALFNDVIIFEANKLNIPVIDLRVICDAVEDYSEVSAIEPSAKGGEKICAAIVEMVTSKRISGRI